MNRQIIYFRFKELYVLFMTLQSIGFNFFVKMEGSCVFCCSSCINFNSASHLKEKITLNTQHFLNEVSKTF